MVLFPSMVTFTQEIALGRDLKEFDRESKYIKHHLCLNSPRTKDVCTTQNSNRATATKSVFDRQHANIVTYRPYQRFPNETLQRAAVSSFLDFKWVESLRPS